MISVLRKQTKSIHQHRSKNKICQKIKEIVKTPGKGEFVLFADFGMFDINALPLYTLEIPITGIRLGFKKGEFDKACNEMKDIISKGYHVYLQDVDTPGYNVHLLLCQLPSIFGKSLFGVLIESHINSSCWYILPFDRDK